MEREDGGRMDEGGPQDTDVGGGYCTVLCNRH